MPVISTRRYSSSYLPSSNTTSSSVGTYRSSYSSLSSNTSSSTKNYSSTTSRYTPEESSYRSTYRPSLSSGISSTTSSYRASRFDDSDKNKFSTNTSLSTRIGVSKTNARLKSDTLPPLPPTASSSLAMSDMDFYEKYSPSRYSTKFELSRARSVSDSTQMTSRDKQSPSPIKSINDSSSHAPKSEVCRQRAQRLDFPFVPNLTSKAFVVFVLKPSNNRLNCLHSY